MKKKHMVNEESGEDIKIDIMDKIIKENHNKVVKEIEITDKIKVMAKQMSENRTRIANKKLSKLQNEIIQIYKELELDCNFNNT